MPQPTTVLNEASSGESTAAVPCTCTVFLRRTSLEVEVFACSLPNRDRDLFVDSC